MRLPIGPDRLSDRDRQELEALRQDPRIARPRGGMVADFWNAMAEAERLRELGVFGLFAMRDALEHEELREGVRRDDPDLTEVHVAALQAAWERAEIARIEIDNEHPHLHAMALISMVSALDAMVEELIPAYQAMLVHGQAHRAVKIAQEKEPEAYAKIGPERAEEVAQALHAVLQQRLPKPRRPSSTGTKRYETPLAQVGLEAPPDRPIPPDLDEALSEITALRHVLIHRAGRVDDTSLKQAPSLSQRYTVGAFVRIDRAYYRRYSGALNCYGAEIVRRSMMGLYDGTQHDVELTQWRDCYRINA
jgi:hypothetical protein